MPTISLAESFDWSEFDRVLKSHVKPGTYQGVKANLLDYAALLDDEAFLKIDQALSRFSPSALDHKQRLAFYINAYNYLAIKIVLDNWPVDGIKDIGSLFKPVWKRPAGKIDGETVTLDQLEHKILRSLKEPRIHFAIVCASMSCPDLRQEIYSAEDLDQQLNQQAQAFLNNPTKGAKIESGDLYLSEIFDWFEEDFESLGGIYAFISRYNNRLKGFSDFETIDYNWELNRQR